MIPQGHKKWEVQSRGLITDSDGLRLGFGSDLSSSRVEFECSINYGTQLRSTPVWEGDLLVETHFSEFPDLQKIKTNTNQT